LPSGFSQRTLDKTIDWSAHPGHVADTSSQSREPVGESSVISKLSTSSM